MDKEKYKDRLYSSDVKHLEDDMENLKKRCVYK